MRADPPDVVRSTPMPGSKWSTVDVVASIGTRIGAAQVVSLVDLLITMSLAGQPERNRQSDHARYTVPAESISADGSAPERSPPASVWCCTAETSTVDRQLVPPSIERKDRTCPPLTMGTITV